MGDLVSAVTNLCKLLDCLIKVSLKPEFFRLCRLNKLGFEQVQQIWDVIHKICCFSTEDTFCSNNPYKCVDNYLREHKGVAAYFLAPDASARQLLLCLGFLLSERIIESNIDKVLLATPFGEELPSFMVKSDTTDDSLETLVRPDEDDPRALLNYTLYVSGKIKHNLRAIANYNQERVQLFFKIHKATADAHGTSHWSVGDLLMAVRPEFQGEFLSRCQHSIPLLQAYSKWHRKKHFFWEWMVTVAEEEFKTESEQHSVAKITHLHEFLRKLKSDVQKVTEVSQEAENEHLCTDNNIQISTRRVCFGGSGEVMDSLIENMNSEINSLQIQNEKKMREIKMNLFKAGDQSVAINSILQTFGIIEDEKKEMSKTSAVDLPLVDKLKTLTTN